MIDSIRRAWRSWVSVGVLAVLCGALAILQYRWIGEVSEAERLTLQKDLETRLALLRRNFDDQIASASRALIPKTAEIEKLGPEQAYAAQYAHWKNSYQPLFDRIALAVPEGDSLALLILNPQEGRYSQSSWPVAWGPMRDQLTARVRGDRMPPFIPEPYALFELPRFGPSPNGALREREWLLLELNLDYVRSTLMPELLSRYLADSGKSEYDAEVVVNGNPSISIYRSVADNHHPLPIRPDASVALLDIRPGMLGRGNARLFRPPATIGDLRQGRWLLTVRHQAGSLEAIVARARRRNIAISGGVLLLMILTLLLLVRFSRKAQQLAELQMNFVAGVSHELRTPLTVIRTAAFNLRGRLAGRPDQVERYGKLIQDETEKLSALVEQVLQYGNAKAGRVIRKRELVPMGALIENSLDSSMAGADGSSLVIEKQIEPGLPFVLADRVALKHAIQNLLDNAVKYGTESNNWIGVFAASISAETGPAVEVRTLDRGPGIPKEEREHVFDPFFRGRRAVEDQVHGTGLGLNLVKKIVEAHGGTIRVETGPGTGTAFIVRLPVAPPEQQDELAHSLG